MDDFQFRMPLEEDIQDIPPIGRNNFKDNSGTRTDRHTTTDLQDMHGPCHQREDIRYKCHIGKEIRINSLAADAAEDHNNMGIATPDNNLTTTNPTRDKDTHMGNSDHLHGGVTRIRNRPRVSLQCKH